MRPLPLHLHLLFACALTLTACATNDLEGQAPEPVRVEPAAAITGGGATVTTPAHRVEIMVTPGRVTPLKTPQHHIRLGVGAPRLAQKELAR